MINILGQPTAQIALNQALCVQKRNYVSEGSYYGYSPTQNPSVFQTSSGQKTYDYIEPTPTVVSYCFLGI